ncbi:MAG: hypothetical protein WD688_21110 [Candidatus Binatia bacterium]
MTAEDLLRSSKRHKVRKGLVYLFNEIQATIFHGMKPEFVKLHPDERVDRSLRSDEMSNCCDAILGRDGYS